MKTYSNEEGAEMEELRFNSVFDIIGPVMIGPSSSHTAGAARIGKVVRVFLDSNLIALTFIYMSLLLKLIVVTEQISP